MIKKIVGLVIAVAVAITGFANVSKVEAASSPKQLIIINKKINQLAFYNNEKLVKIYPVATGKYDSYTPEGTFTVYNKIKNRPYYSKGIKGGDPRNPLGDRWLGLDARGTKGTTYAIHGNNNESSIGKYVSAGCVRMKNNDVRELYEKVSVGATVKIVNTTKTFAEIAGYSTPQVPALKFETFTQPVTLLENVNIYNTPDLNGKRANTITAQTVEAVQRSGNWFLVKTWLGNKYIYTTNYVVGKKEYKNQQIKISEKKYLYKNPTDKTAAVGAASPQILQSVAKLGEWYLVKTYAGDLWVKVSGNVTVEPTQPKLETFTEPVTLFENVNIYDTPDLNSKRANTISAQTVEAVKRSGNWFLIKTWLGEKYVYANNYVVGKKEYKTEQISISEKKYLYKNPTDKSAYGAVSPQSLQSIATLGNWHLVKSYAGELWMKI